MEEFNMNEIPDDSLQHIEALLTRHPPHVILRMFNQVVTSRTASSETPRSPFLQLLINV